VNVKVDKTLVASVALHVLVIGWGLVSFSSKAFESVPEESLPVDIISADQLAKVTAGMKTGKKENPKPLVEKVAEAKPVDDSAVGKISEKPPVVTDTSPPPTPKVEEKPVEKKPDPPKPVAETKPKEEPKPQEKPAEKKPDPPKVDPIAEALKKEEKKPPPKPQAQAATPPQPPKPKAERTFDQSKIAALLDKRDPTRQAVTGDTLNSNAALGLSKGKAADNSATWGAMFMQQVRGCWKKPYGGVDTKDFFMEVQIKLKRDGSLEGTPVALTSPRDSFQRVFLESAMRATVECAPYRLPPAFFEEWKDFIPQFSTEEKG
jgi:outer membrane biosynthesis protein TonB